MGLPRAIESHEGLFSDGNLFAAVKKASAPGMPHAAEREQQFKYQTSESCFGPASGTLRFLFVGI
jgi:hypothetical protein